MTPEQPETAILALQRDAHVFAHRPGLAAQLDAVKQTLPLAPDQLLHAEVPAVYLVRLGKLRVTQFLPDGREVTRAVLQAGAAFSTLPAGAAAPDPQADRYPLTDIVLASLGEAELWALPPGALDTDLYIT